MEKYTMFLGTKSGIVKLSVLLKWIWIVNVITVTISKSLLLEFN